MKQTKSRQEYLRNYYQRNKESIRKRARVYRQDNKNLINESNRAYYQRNKHIISEYYRARHEKIKKDTLAAYGNKCVCCGESNTCFLVLDHVNSDGSEQRRNPGTLNTVSLCRWAKRNGYPKTLQVLCHNCNAAKQYDPKGHCLAHPNAHLVHGSQIKQCNRRTAINQIDIQPSFW